jgi:uncharacterized protein (DUF1501 family)
VSDSKVRINITIGETELELARASGESVSAYIRRLIVEDADGHFIKIPVPTPLYAILSSSGVLEGARASMLMQDLTQVLADHADAALMASRESLKAVITGMNPKPE